MMIKEEREREKIHTKDYNLFKRVLFIQESYIIISK